jgi:hypothetical protein
LDIGISTSELIVAQMKISRFAMKPWLAIITARLPVTAIASFD